MLSALALSPCPLTCHPTLVPLPPQSLELATLNRVSATESFRLLAKKKQYWPGLIINLVACEQQRQQRRPPPPSLPAAVITCTGCVLVPLVIPRPPPPPLQTRCSTGRATLPLCTTGRR